jgi:hypothetical protein
VPKATPNINDSSRLHQPISPMLRFLLAVPVAGLLFFANVSIARAHWEANLHWNKTGDHIEIRQLSTGEYSYYADQARQNGYATISILYNYDSAVHTDISAYSVYVGDTGPAGQWHLESADWDWGTMGYNHITHAHSWFNEYYAYSPWSLTGSQIQGVFCQEIAHGWGLDHSATNDCMGYGYYYNDKYYYGSHNNDDFYNKYRYH